MLLDIVPLALLKNTRSHILVLDSLIGQKSRGETTGEIHPLKASVIEIRNFFIASGVLRIVPVVSQHEIAPLRHRIRTVGALHGLRQIRLIQRCVRTVDVHLSIYNVHRLPRQADHTLHIVHLSCRIIREMENNHVPSFRIASDIGQS